MTFQFSSVQVILSPFSHTMYIKYRNSKMQMINIHSVTWEDMKVLDKLNLFKVISKNEELVC